MGRINRTSNILASARDHIGNISTKSRFIITTTTIIGETRNTSCAIWCLAIKAFFDYKMLHDGCKTIVTNGILGNINNRVFKLPRLANFDLHRNLT